MRAEAKRPTVYKAIHRAARHKREVAALARRQLWRLHRLRAKAYEPSVRRAA